MNDINKKIENLENQIFGLKVKLARLKDFLTSFPNAKNYFPEENEEDDVLLDEAKNIMLEHDSISASLIQRKMALGYARSARIINQMEKKGWISASNRSKPRKVLIKK